MHTNGEDLLRELSKLFHLRLFVPNDQCKSIAQQIILAAGKYFFMKIFITMIPAILIVNSVFSFFFLYFCRNQKQKSKFLL